MNVMVFLFSLLDLINFYTETIVDKSMHPLTYFSDEVDNGILLYHDEMYDFHFLEEWENWVCLWYVYGNLKTFNLEPQYLLIFFFLQNYSSSFLL